MSTDEARAIAGRLTKAQRRMFEHAMDRRSEIYGVNAVEVSPGSSARPLIRLGLIREREWRGLSGLSRRGYGLTPLGLAVRAILMETSDER